MNSTLKVSRSPFAEIPLRCSMHPPSRETSLVSSVKSPIQAKVSSDLDLKSLSPRSVSAKEEASIHSALASLSLLASEQSRELYQHNYSDQELFLAGLNGYWKFSDLPLHIQKQVDRQLWMWELLGMSNQQHLLGVQGVRNSNEKSQSSLKNGNHVSDKNASSSSSTTSSSDYEDYSSESDQDDVNESEMDQVNSRSAVPNRMTLRSRILMGRAGAGDSPLEPGQLIDESTTTMAPPPPSRVQYNHENSHPVYEWSYNENLDNSLVQNHHGDESFENHSVESELRHLSSAKKRKPQLPDYTVENDPVIAAWGRGRSSTSPDAKQQMNVTDSEHLGSSADYASSAKQPTSHSPANELSWNPKPQANSIKNVIMTYPAPKVKPKRENDEDLNEPTMASVADQYQSSVSVSQSPERNSETRGRSPRRHGSFANNQMGSSLGAVEEYVDYEFSDEDTNVKNAHAFDGDLQRPIPRSTDVSHNTNDMPPPIDTDRYSPNGQRDLSNRSQPNARHRDFHMEHNFLKEQHRKFMEEAERANQTQSAPRFQSHSHSRSRSVRKVNQNTTTQFKLNPNATQFQFTRLNNQAPPTAASVGTFKRISRQHSDNSSNTESFPPRDEYIPRFSYNQERHRAWYGNPPYSNGQPPEVAMSQRRNHAQSFSSNQQDQFGIMRENRGPAYMREMSPEQRHTHSQPPRNGRHSTLSPEHGTRLVVRNLPLLDSQRAAHQKRQIYSLFKQHGTVIYLQIANDNQNSGQAHCSYDYDEPGATAHVQYSTADEASEALLALNDSFILGRCVQVSFQQ